MRWEKSADTGRQRRPEPPRRPYPAPPGQTPGAERPKAERPCSGRESSSREHGRKESGQARAQNPGRGTRHRAPGRNGRAPEPSQESANLAEGITSVLFGIGRRQGRQRPRTGFDPRVNARMSYGTSARPAPQRCNRLVAGTDASTEAPLLEASQIVDGAGHTAFQRLADQPGTRDAVARTQRVEIVELRRGQADLDDMAVGLPVRTIRKLSGHGGKATPEASPPARVRRCPRPPGRARPKDGREPARPAAPTPGGW